jgi:hypothetical protein
MSPRVIAAVLGAAGGLLLLVSGGLSFLSHESRDLYDVVAVVGYAATVAALVATGYALVAQAPVWLRIIVSIGLPLLLASAWQVVDQALDDQLEGWKGAATTHVLGGVVVLAVALGGLRRSQHDGDQGYAPTHHR